MSPESWRCTRRTLLKGAVLAFAGGVSAGCDEDLLLLPTLGRPVIMGSFHIIGEGMYEAFKRWRDSLNDVDRAIIEKLISLEDLLIHVFLATGRLSDTSRGAESAPASHPDMKRICDAHPIVGRFATRRDWDVAYDPERTKWFEESYGIPCPPEVVLYHEIFGHVIPGLRDPNIAVTPATDPLLKDSDECRALGFENRYRRQIGLREVPPKLLKCLSP